MSTLDIPSAEQRFVWYQLSWDQYEGLLRVLGDRRLRHTYVEGTLEIMSPSLDHESTKSLIRVFVEMLCRSLKLPRRSIGSTTMRKKAWRRGLEPDEGFYIGRQSVGVMRGRRSFDPDRDPPPDLIVEVDITASSKDRMQFYQQMRVPEVWRYANENVSIYVIGKSGRYRSVKRSRLFSLVTPDDLTRFVSLRDTLDDTQIELQFETWVKSRIGDEGIH